jgi:hypothetical protein
MSAKISLQRWEELTLAWQRILTVSVGSLNTKLYAMYSTYTYIAYGPRVDSAPNSSEY